MKKTLLASLILAACTSAHADVRINGFANLVMGKASSGDTLYGYDDDIGFDPDSLFAVQFSGDINDKMTATAQVLARGSDDYDVDFEWAYLTYAATDNVSVSAGRLRLPLFRYSASLDVGYSYHWVKAPNAVYSVPFNNIDGFRVDYSNYSGDLEYTLQLTAGNIENDTNIGGQPARIEIKNVIAATAELAYENWKFRGVAARGKSTFDVPALDPALGQLAQISAELSDLLAVTDDTGQFYGVGIEYDNFNWFVGAEYTMVKLEDSFYPDESNYYVTAGFRSGKWTPFITYENSDLNDGLKFMDRIGAFPAPYQGPLTQLLGGVQQAVVSESDAWSVGVRYDFDTNIALKADVTSFSDELDSGNDANLMRFAVNYVF